MEASGSAAVPETHRVEDMSWDVVARRLAEGADAILPVGAGAKQHGWHLPMRTDAIQAEWLAGHLADRLSALVWPTLAYGHYPAFVAYAGSCSLSAPLFEGIVREIVDALLGYGARRVLVLDTGISTIAPINRALAGCTAPGRALHLQAYHGPAYRAAAARLATQAHGGHADELETSILLAIAPAAVAMARAAASHRADGRDPARGDDRGHGGGRRRLRRLSRLAFFARPFDKPTASPYCVGRGRPL